MIDFDDTGDREPDELDLNEDFPLGDGTADMSADVRCPYCGEAVEISLDPGGGETQEYVEDCEVCCQPWRLIVSYDGFGSAQVFIEAMS